MSVMRARRMERTTRRRAGDARVENTKTASGDVALDFIESHSRIDRLKLFGKAMVGARERHHRVRLDGDLVKRATVPIAHA